LPVAGIDIGSITTEVVIMEKKEVLGYVIIPTGSNSKNAAEKALEKASQKAGCQVDELDFVIATGYGRISAPAAHKKVTEITCHGKGAFSLLPEARTVIDIGGQDSKVIRLSEEGNVVDFVMNEKCAAGTGRFLEVMAYALEVELKDMAELSKKAARSIPISSMCTVFAESEVVSLIASDKAREDIIRGIHDSIAERTVGLVNRVGLEEKVIMTGGVAQNQGVVECLENKLNVKIEIPENPQIVGALGAAILAEKEINN